MASASRWRCLTDNEMAALLNAKEDLAKSDNCMVDSDASTDNEEENVIISDQDDDSDASGTRVTTDTYVWEDVINYIGRREMSTGVSGPQDSAQSVTEIMDIFNYFLARNLLARLQQTQTTAQQYKNSKGKLFSKR
jgi:hypothetical protein